MPENEQRRTRREEYADLTRHEIVRTARRMFAESGWAQTTVESIARAARVSPATVYAQCGGKDGLLEALMDLWTTSDLVAQIIADCAAAPTPLAKLERLALGYVAIYEESGDIIQIVTRASANAPSAAVFLTVADERHREALRQIVDQVDAAGGLATGVSVEQAVQVIFFHFRYGQFSLLADEFGWGVERAAQWLTNQIALAILKQ